MQGNVDWEGGGGPEVGDEVPLDDVALRAAEVQPRGGEAEAAALTQSPQLDGRAHYICPQMCWIRTRDINVPQIHNSRLYRKCDTSLVLNPTIPLVCTMATKSVISPPPVKTPTRQQQGRMEARRGPSCLATRR